MSNIVNGDRPPLPPQLPTSRAPSSFSSLPPEIHVKIYEHYFCSADPSGLVKIRQDCFGPGHPSNKSLTRLHHRGPAEAAYVPTNILFTGREIHREALTIFYASHNFSFSQLVCSAPSPPNYALYVAPKYGNDFLQVAPYLRNLWLSVTPQLFQTQDTRAFRCPLQLDMILPEMLQVCPVLRTITFDLDSKPDSVVAATTSRADPVIPPNHVGHWFLAGQSLDKGIKSFPVFGKARIRLELSTASFQSQAGRIMIPEDQQLLHKVFLCDLDHYADDNLNESKAYEAALEAVVYEQLMTFKKRAARNPRGRLIGWTQEGREIWKAGWWKAVLKARR